MRREKSWVDVILKYEFKLTQTLIDNGYVYDTLIPLKIEKFEATFIRVGNSNKTAVCPLTMIKDYEFPFIKKKVFDGDYKRHKVLMESADSILNYIKDKNEILFSLITEHIKTNNWKQELLSDYKTLIYDASVVSFDIFDTLLIRPYVDPIGVTQHIEKIYNAAGFCLERGKADVRARKKYLTKDREDITFDDIYNEILPEFLPLKQTEIEFEAQLLRIHPDNFKIYNEAVSQGKKIIAISDMYLPSSFLKDVLFKNGYTNVDKIYVSSEYRKTKTTGNLFKLVLDDLKINPNQLLHIGDNEYSDIIAPQDIGIKTYFIKKYINTFFEYAGNHKYKHFYDQNPCLERNIITAMIALHHMKQKTYDYWYDIGYSLSGQLAVGYTNFIINKSTQNNIDTLLFLSRDGYSLQKVYNILAENKIPNYYLYASRNIALRCYANHRDRNIYLKKIFDMVSGFIPALKTTGTDYTTNISLFSKYKNKIKEWASANLEDFLKYFLALNINGRHIAAVDMITGDGFTSAAFMKAFLEENYAFCFYFATGTNNYEYKYLSYKKDVIKNFFSSDNIKYVLLIEFLINAPEPSVVDIKNGNPVFNIQHENSDIITAYKRIDAGIVQFAKDYKYIFGCNMINFTMETNISMLESFCQNLTDVDKTYLKNINLSLDLDHKDFKSIYDIIHNSVIP